MARQVEKSPIVKAVTPKLDKSAGLRYQEQEDIVSILYDPFSLTRKAPSYGKAS